MKIFISWSGERSEALAKALREWFPLVLHFVDPWLSKSDIEAGERWGIEIAKELENCNFGVICITRENLNSAWILFEAGALAKSMQDGRVIPLLLDLDFKEISGPLAQFQSKKADHAGIKELVLSLNKAATAPVPEPQLDKLLTALWDDLEKQIGAIPKNAATQKHGRPQGEILEELVSSVRNVEMRFRDIADDVPRTRRRRHRLHPMMFEENLHGLDIDDPMRLLMMASTLREDYPWIYELAAEAYRASLSGHPPKAREAQHRFIAALHALRRGPFLEISGDKESFMIVHELTRMIEKFLHDDLKKTPLQSNKEVANVKKE